MTFALQGQHFENQSVTVQSSERLSVFLRAHHDSQSSLMAFVLYKADCDTQTDVTINYLL